MNLTGTPQSLIVVSKGGKFFEGKSPSKKVSLLSKKPLFFEPLLKSWRISVNLIRCIIFFLIIDIITLWYLAEARTVNRIVAWVNEEIITQVEIDKRISISYSNVNPEQMYKVRKQVLDELIEEKIILQEAKRQKIQPSRAEVEEILERVKKQFNSVEDFKKALKVEGLTEDDLRKKYEEELMKKELINREVWANIHISNEELEQIRNDFIYQIKVRHILVKTKPEAILILARLDKGEKFEELANKYSIDPTSRDKGGIIGFFTKEKMIKEFADASFELKNPGEISGPVKTKLGFHIIQLLEKKELPEEEREKIINEQKAKLKQQKFKEEFKKWIDKLKEKMYIKIDWGEKRS